MRLDRATTIRQLLFARGQLTIAEIAEAVAASEPTVRRDLAILESDGAIVRTHGGARLAREVGGEIAFETREQIRLPEKRAIGEAAYALLRPGSSVFLDAGTTALQLARLIRLRPLDLNAFTNCLPLAQLLMSIKGVSVTLLGGTMRAENASMVGPLAEEALERLRFDQVFLGMSGLGDDLAIYSVDPQEARLNALTLSRTEHAIILTDSTKFGTYLTHRVARLEPNLSFITDSGLARSWRDRLGERGIPVQIVEPLA